MIILGKYKNDYLTISLIKIVIQYTHLLIVFIFLLFYKQYLYTKVSSVEYKNQLVSQNILVDYY